MTHSRHGVSLVELLVVMTASTVVITLTGSLLCRVMRIQLESRTHVEVERNSLRLGEQFRHDVQAAQAAATSQDELGDDALLELRFPDGQQAEYTRQGKTVLRRVRGAGRPASREEFVFPAACDVSIQQHDSPPQLTLTITTGPTRAGSDEGKPIAQALAVPVSLQATAALGRNLRFTTAAAEQEAPE